jgi:subtilisin family serine protease
MVYGGRLGRVLIAAAVTGTAVAGGVLPAGTSAAAAPEAPQARPTSSVTLITGDVVTLAGAAAHVRPGPGREHIGFAQRHDQRGDLHVVPSDVDADLSAGRLDPRLFDVTELIRSGYDDASRPDVPLIVTDAGGLRTTGVALPSVDGVAVRADKSTAFLSGARAGKIWLDGPVHASLDRSVPQIGAPEAWQAGHTGQGTTVAVLDSGLDATHPDLADAVVEARDFSGSASGTDDKVGHGTHVASIITGDGAASAGKYRGVAPDAKLLVGKVLDDFGQGTESSIIAGMEWAAAAHADVANLSLGNRTPSDGTDLVSRALNRLTAESGTLFVVAADNEGPGDGTVTSPGAADAALTVGAVDRNDALAATSSRGPRIGDGAIKPDITAPGVGIVAARAAHGWMGQPVDAKYTAISGTSMATPHVSGAAAILAGQHPEWTAEQLKAALTGSAKPNPAHNVYQQGAGRVDVARADRQQAFATPSSLSLGLERWPHNDDQPTVKTVMYHNSGTEPLSLHVTADVPDPTGKPAPAGMFTVSPSDVVVPPGGTVDVAVTTNTTVDAPDGLYSGAVVASGGSTAVRTPIGVTREAESYDLSVTFLNREGVPTGGYQNSLTDRDRRTVHPLRDPSGTTAVRVPRGRYFVQSTLYGPGGVTALVEPNLEVTGDAEVVLDGREAKPVEFTTDKPNARSSATEVYFDEKTPWGHIDLRLNARTPDSVFVRPSTTSAAGTFTTTMSTTMAEPDGKGGFVDSPYLYNLRWSHNDKVPAQVKRAFADKDLAKVRTEFAAQAPGKAGVRSDTVMAALPFSLAEYYSPNTPFDTSFNQWSALEGGQFETIARTMAPRTYRLGRTVTERWNSAVFGPTFSPVENMSAPLPKRTGDRISVDVSMFSEQSSTYGFSIGVDPASTTLERDGVEVARTPYEGSISAAVPPGKASYRLHTDATRSGVSELSTRVSADWTFTSEHVTDATPLPLLAIRFAPDLDDRNRAAAGRAFTIPFSLHRNGSAQPGKVNRPSLQVSYDDGVTWRQAPVIRTGDQWLAAVMHPKDAKFVSLKASATDAAGNTVSQTVIRAYALK